LDDIQKKMIGTRIADRYLITGTIGSGGMGLVLGAIPFEDPSREVAIKIIRQNKRMGPDVLMRFQKEAALMSRLHHPNIISFLELGLMDAEASGFSVANDGRTGSDGNDVNGSPGGYYIVMERASGRNLKEIVGRSGRQSLRFFFQLGIQVAQALDYTHRKNIVHRDIKPQNIIVDRPFGDSREVRVKVLDFGIASLSEAVLFTGKDHTTANKRVLDEVAGTPLYMAPELTRMIDAPADHRVDLYSLGCVLYEALSGHTPFSADSREKLEKLHAFATPEPLSARCPDVPAFVEAIVHKLLSKHPDQRYQSAFGLQADLVRAQALHERGVQSAESFQLGRFDQISILSRPMAFSGRGAEMNNLFQSYEAVASAQGRSRMTVVRGPAGAGKSRLLGEFRDDLVRRQIRFISGRFSSHESALPFNALANAFNEYLLRLSRSQSAEATEFHDKVKTLLGPLAHQIAQVVPGLRPFVADIPEPEVMFGPDEEGFKAFAKVFSDFTRCLASDATPFVFIFDDLQWADDKSVRLIDQFFSNANSQRFLLIVSVRSGSVTPGSEVARFLDRFSRLKRRFVEFEVHPISRDEIGPLIEATLGSSFLGNSGAEGHFYDWIHSRTGGNMLHLTELLRALVANDHLRFGKGGLWNVDLQKLAADPPKVDSVDLVLGRLQEFQESDRRILEAAAVAGISFQFETLRHVAEGGLASGSNLVQALQRAVEEGIIVRGAAEEETRNLGKSYSFIHSRAREDIYATIPQTRRALLHLSTAQRIEATVDSPGDKVIFALAQHFNRSLDAGFDAVAADPAEVRSLLQRTIKYNLRAGQAALRSNSLQTAETYFSAVERLMEKSPDGTSELADRLRVQETLADLAAAQRKTQEASRRYRTLIGLDMPDGKRVVLANKIVRFYVSLGIFSESIRLVEDSLKRLGLPFLDTSWWSRLLARASLLRDAFLVDRRFNKMFLLLKKAFKNSPEKSAAGESSGLQVAVELYQNASHIQLYRDRDFALLAHDGAFRQAMRSGAPARVLVRLVAERAAVLACAGYFRAAFQAFDMVMDVTKASGMRSDFAYGSLLRVISGDYLRSRHDEMSDHLRSVLSNLDPKQDRLAQGLALTFQLHRELHRLNFKRIKQLSSELPEYRALRSPVSARAVMISSLAFLLRDSRDEIVNFAESFLKRRREDGGRLDDAFSKAISVMVSFARGELDKSAGTYGRLFERMAIGSDREFMWPFEEDCLAIFLFVFPVLYRREAGRDVMPEKDFAAIAGRFDSVIRNSPESGRAVPTLLRARIAELNGNHKKAKYFYDASLAQAKLAGDNFVQVLGYFWFGAFLARIGLKPRVDYLRRAAMLASKGGVKAIQDAISKSGGPAIPRVALSINGSTNLSVADLGAASSSRLEGAAGASFARDASTRQNSAAGWPVGKVHPLELAHLRLLSSLDMRRLDEDAEVLECLALVSRSFEGSRVFLLRRGADRNIDVLQPVGQQASRSDMQSVLNYLNPYLHLKSSLFLPLHDAPWLKHTTGTPGNGQVTEESSVDEDDVKTFAPVRLDYKAAVDRVALPGGGAPVPGEPEKPESPGGGMAIGLGAVVPLQWPGESLGVMFIENTGALVQQDTSAVRNALDMVGGHLAFAIQKRHRGTVYRSGTFLMESQPWLRSWDVGNFRSQRETGWYLGLNFGPDRHVLFYLSCSGPEEARVKFGSSLWHHLFAFRSVKCRDSGSPELDAFELRSELARFLLSDKSFARLQTISLSFSLVMRTRNLIASGHFGTSRPVVINGSNRVSPGNDSIMTLSSGSELRFWDVESTFGEQQLLIVSYDTTRLDGISLASPNSRSSRHGGEQPFDELFMVERPLELHQVLAARLPVDSLPRYYVAVMRQRTERAITGRPVVVGGSNAQGGQSSQGGGSGNNVA
jgi:serine/threonine protein kinase